MKNEKHYLFLGRFQPFHLGHKTLIGQKLDEGQPCLILVRDISPDEKNPFTTKQTVQMIEKVYEGKDVKVMTVPDIAGICFGRGVGYTVEELVLPDNIQRISATGIRNSIQEGTDDWKENVDESIHDMVVEFLDENGFL